MPKTIAAPGKPSPKQRRLAGYRGEVLETTPTRSADREGPVEAVAELKTAIGHDMDAIRAPMRS